MAEKKPPIAALFREVAKLLMGEEPCALRKLTGPFPIDYVVTRDGVVLESNDHKIVKVTTKDSFVANVMGFLDTRLPVEIDKEIFGLDYNWTGEQGESFYKKFIYTYPRIDMPKTWAWADDEALTFHRLPFTGREEGETPTWDELMSRTTNAKPLMAWIGSLFISESARQQYIWLFGEGGDGKGSVIRFLEAVFGDAFGSEEPPSGDGKRFWTAGLVGKRLVAFTDTNDARWPTSGLFKTISGGDSVRVELKGGKAFTMRLDAKFLFSSNERPDITSRKADLRRVIMCEFSSPAEAIPDFEARLWAEGGAFLRKCIALYHDLCPGHGNIASDTSAIESWAAAVDDEYQATFDRIFVHETQEKCRWISAPLYMRAIQRAYHDPRQRRAFRLWIERRYRAQRLSVRDERKHVYTYIAANPTAFKIDAVAELN